MRLDIPHDGFISSLDPCFDNQKVVGRGDLAIGQTLRMSNSKGTTQMFSYKWT